jgi:hypothetical protein
VLHETVDRHHLIPYTTTPVIGILCDALQHTLRLEDEGGKRDSTQVRARPQLRDNRHEHYIRMCKQLLESKLGARLPTALLAVVHDHLLLGGPFCARRIAGFVAYPQSGRVSTITLCHQVKLRINQGPFRGCRTPHSNRRPTTQGIETGCLH